MKGDRLQKAMEGLGTALVLSSEELFTLLQEFVCKLYASQTSLCRMNDLRYGLIIKYVHEKDCLEQETATPSPEGQGWMIEDSN